MPAEDHHHLPMRRKTRRRDNVRLWAPHRVFPVLALLLIAPLAASPASRQPPLVVEDSAETTAPAFASVAGEDRHWEPVTAGERVGPERLEEPSVDRPPASLPQHASFRDRPSTPPSANGAPVPASGAPSRPATHTSDSHEGGVVSASALAGMECTGYPEPRIFIETQDWWASTSGEQDGESGHVHVGTCFPYLQQIRGVVRFDLRVVMHENPGHLRRVDVAIYPADDSGLVVPVDFGRDCAGTCVFTAPVHIDTSTVSDGWQEFRFKARVDQPDGSEMLTSSGWKTYLDNGNAVNGSDGGSGVTARGWYTDVGYQNAYIDALPAGPVSGIWTFTLKLVPGADGTPTTSHLVAVDPDFHHHDPGLVIKEDSGECRCTVSIDTTQLANGFHRLFLRSDSALATGITHSGVLAFAFEVRNP